MRRNAVYSAAVADPDFALGIFQVRIKLGSDRGKGCSVVPALAVLLASGVASFFISVSLNVPSTATSSSHQQDLPDTTLFSLCLSLGRFIEWQFLADWYYQLAIPHRLGH